MTAGAKHEYDALPRWESVEDDHALAIRSRENRELFGVLYDRYVDRIYGYCYRRLQSHAAAEDATSQTFLKALTAIRSYREDATSFRAWLFRIAHNVIVDMWRAHRPMLGLDNAFDVAASGTSPEDQALESESSRELYALVSQLPEEQIEIVHLRLAGMTDREIADVLGKSHGAIRIAQHRAIKRLKELAQSSNATTRTTP